jgi:hypothetical protein
VPEDISDEDVIGHIFRFEAVAADSGIGVPDSSQILNPQVYQFAIVRQKSLSPFCHPKPP